MSRKIDSVETLDIFNSHINRTLAETLYIDISRWLVNQLTASFDGEDMGIDKRQLKRKLIISHGALQRFAPTLEKDLNSNITLTLAAGQRHQRYSSDSISSEAHEFLFSLAL